MKKVYIIAAVAIIVIGGAVASFFLKKGSSTSSTETKQAHFTTYDACNLLTKDHATQLLGTSATLGQEPSPSHTDDLRVTNCIYNNNAGNIKDIVSISALVRSPLTTTGAQSNDETFTNTSVVGETSVSGYGEKAAWNGATGQLHVLKEKNWIIITFGKVQANTRTLEDAKKAADLLIK